MRLQQGLLYQQTPWLLANTRSGFTMSANLSKRGSGTGTTPVFGSIVQNGKFAASIPALR